MGKVYLVGAGCGALDLYTIKAMKCIQNADCLIYDALIDSRILEACKKECECIYVGKRQNKHAMKQEDICELLVEKSKQYDSIVRLKGGDVYVFGRGGEEGEVLSNNHVDFEVVPGLSSVTAGLAYAGIPITHRGLSGGFQVYTGFLQEGQPREFDFHSMLDDYCTYVFLMSMSRIDYIVDGFLSVGKDENTGIGIVSQASLPTQRCLISTLKSVKEDIKQNPLPNPGIIVVGNVVNMRKHLNFYETKPLFSKKCLITTVGRDHDLKNKLEDLGAHTYEVMTGDIEYLDCPIPRINGYLVFTSKHGVIGFMKNFFKHYKDVRELTNATIVCIGDKTNHVLNTYGLNADLIPSKADSDVLMDELSSLCKDKEVYLVKGENKTTISFHTKECVVYRNKEINIPSEVSHYDFGLFTCASSVKRFKKSNDSLCDTYISIGAHTSKAIRECYGNVDILEASYASKDEMIRLMLGEKICLEEED